MFKSKLKKWLGNGVTVLLLVIGLVLWISLPWIGVLAVAVLVALWLLLTRGGRLALAATRIGVASLPQRWGASSVCSSSDSEIITKFPIITIMLGLQIISGKCRNFIALVAIVSKRANNRILHLITKIILWQMFWDEFSKMGIGFDS